MIVVPAYNDVFFVVTSMSFVSLRFLTRSSGRQQKVDLARNGRCIIISSYVRRGGGGGGVLLSMVLICVFSEALREYNSAFAASQYFISPVVLV